MCRRLFLPWQILRCALPSPHAQLAIGIHTVSRRGTELKAELSGKNLPLTDATLLKMFFKYPFHTFRVIALIHWYALKLFFRGVPHYAKASADAAIVHANLRRNS